MLNTTGKLIVGIIFILAMWVVIIFVPAVRSAEGIERRSYDSFHIDPIPHTEYNEKQATLATPPKFRAKKYAKLIGRIGTGIKRWKLKRDHAWYECGNRLDADDPTLDGLSMTWAYHLVKSAWEASDNPNLHDNAFVINPWTFAAVSANESGFDRCAVGKGFRDLAYRKKGLKPNRLCISHPRTAIIKFYNTDGKKAFSRTGVDAGPFQELTRFYGYDIEDMLTLDPAVYRAGRRMRSMHQTKRTNRPYGCWRGPCLEWYRLKIEKYARQLGATTDDIQDTGAWYRNKPVI